MASGQELIEQCKQHILAVMRNTPQCSPTGDGLGSSEIAERCDLKLELPKHDGWFTWSFLMRMAIDEQLDIVYAKRGKRFRLVASE